MEGSKTRCQAMKLLPKSRIKHNYKTGEVFPDFRCSFNVKGEGNFCGVHKQLEEFIVSIDWKEEIDG